VGNEYFVLMREHERAMIQLISPEGANILSLARIDALLAAVQQLRSEAEEGLLKALILTGNENFFSAGADLKEIARLSGPEAFAFSRRGQELTTLLDRFPVAVTAAIRGYCMGGGMDLALACDHRIAAPNAVFGHRGASLGVITGWGGTQRLPRLIGKTRALQMFLLAEMVPAEEALRIGLVDKILEEPLSRASALTK
jgi:enoyl-CoA hydratase/carnithine racemase